MRAAALVLGVTGGVVGVLATAIMLGFGGFNPSRDVEQAARLLVRGQVAIAFTLLGLVGAALALARPTLGAGLLLMAALGFLTTVSWFAIITTPLFLMAAFFAFLGRKGHATRP